MKTRWLPVVGLAALLATAGAADAQVFKPFKGKPSLGMSRAPLPSGTMVKSTGAAPAPALPPTSPGVPTAASPTAPRTVAAVPGPATRAPTPHLAVTPNPKAPKRHRPAAGGAEGEEEVIVVDDDDAAPKPKPRPKKAKPKKHADDDDVTVTDDE